MYQTSIGTRYTAKKIQLPARIPLPLRTNDIARERPLPPKRRGLHLHPREPPIGFHPHVITRRVPMRLRNVKSPVRRPRHKTQLRPLTPLLASLAITISNFHNNSFMLIPLCAADALVRGLCSSIKTPPIKKRPAGRSLIPLKKAYTSIISTRNTQMRHLNYKFIIPICINIAEFMPFLPIDKISAKSQILTFFALPYNPRVLPFRAGLNQNGPIWRCI